MPYKQRKSRNSIHTGTNRTFHISVGSKTKTNINILFKLIPALNNNHFISSITHFYKFMRRQMCVVCLWLFVKCWNILTVSRVFLPKMKFNCLLFSCSLLLCQIYIHLMCMIGATLKEAWQIYDVSDCCNVETRHKLNQREKTRVCKIIFYFDYFWLS